MLILMVKLPVFEDQWHLCDHHALSNLRISGGGGGGGGGGNSGVNFGTGV